MGCLRCSTPKSSTLHPSSPTCTTDGSACKSERRVGRGNAHQVTVAGQAPLSIHCERGEGDERGRGTSRGEEQGRSVGQGERERLTLYYIIKPITVQYALRLVSRVPVSQNNKSQIQARHRDRPRPSNLVWVQDQDRDPIPSLSHVPLPSQIRGFWHFCYCTPAS